MNDQIDPTTESALAGLREPAPVGLAHATLVFSAVVSANSGVSSLLAFSFVGGFSPAAAFFFAFCSCATYPLRR